MITRIYVVAGRNNSGTWLNSIEFLDITHKRTTADRWFIFTVKELSPRLNPAVSRISATQIVIMGGYGDQKLSDIILVDTKTHEGSVALTNCGKMFTCWANTTLFGKNTVYSLVEEG